MKRVLGTIGVGLILGTGLVACSKTPPTPVTVTSKEVEPGEWETKKKQVCDGWRANKPRTDANCTKWARKDVKEWDDQDFVLHLSDGREVDVSEEEYNDWQEGQVYRD